MNYADKEDASRKIRWAERWQQRGRSVGAAQLASGRLSKGHRRWLVAQGVVGFLADLIHSHSRGQTLLDRFEKAGWPGVQAALMRIDAPTSKKALMETILFSRWGFRMEWCEWKEHWYVRQPRGRPPKSCPFHSRSARQARWKTRKLKKEVGVDGILAMVGSRSIRRRSGSRSR